MNVVERHNIYLMKESTTMLNTLALHGVVKKYGLNYMRKIARKGGRTTVQLYGTEYFRLLGLLGNNHLSKTRETKIRREIREILQPY